MSGRLNVAAYYGAISAFASADAAWGINRMFKRLREWDEAMEGSS